MSAASPAGEPGCGSSSRYWVIPIAGALLALAVAVGVLLATGVVSVPSGGPPYSPFWPIFPLGFLAFGVVVVLVVRPWGWGRYRYDPWDGAADAESVVRIRYARGEISREQLGTMLRDLREPPSGPGTGSRLS